MRRRLFNFALSAIAVLVLLLSTGSLAMWVRSWYRDDAWVSQPRLTNTPTMRWMPSGPWELHQRVGSTHGRLVWAESVESYREGPVGFEQSSASGWVPVRWPRASSIGPRTSQRPCPRERCTALFRVWRNGRSCRRTRSVTGHPAASAGADTCRCRGWSPLLPASSWSREPFQCSAEFFGLKPYG